LILLIRSCFDLGMYAFVVRNTEPCGKFLVKLLQTEDVTGPDFGFELVLSGQKKSFMLSST
jgi:hypothetical protein